jgi:hypothetical protein
MLDGENSRRIQGYLWGAVVVTTPQLLGVNRDVGKPAVGVLTICA